MPPINGVVGGCSVNTGYYVYSKHKTDVMRVVHIRTIFECELSNSNHIEQEFVVPISQEDRVSFVHKRCEELRKKAADAIQESLDLVATLTKKN